MSHPLTDEICFNILDNLDCSLNDDLRAAYDKGYDKGRADMLEQVSKWIKREVDGSYLSDTGEFWQKIDVEDIIYDLRKAMRPQENNS